MLDNLDSVTLEPVGLHAHMLCKTVCKIFENSLGTSTTLSIKQFPKSN
jgi:hypothetical protein